MLEVPFLMEEFATIVETSLQISPRLMEVAMNFVCRLYSNESNEVNEIGSHVLFLAYQNIQTISISTPVPSSHNISFRIAIKVILHRNCVKIMSFIKIKL